MSLQSYLSRMVAEQASDLYLISGGKPSVRSNGKVKMLDSEILSSDDILTLARSHIHERYLTELTTNHELNLAISCNGERFRVNMYHQNGGNSMVVRHIPATIPDFNSLAIPEVAGQLSMMVSGLVLVVGATGMGKSTTVAAMLDYRNQNSEGHIITIEDPIEYLHTHKNCLVTQREIGIDTDSYESALKNALRQAPDVIVIGEIRDKNALLQALSFAQTGHLAIATMHARNASQAIDRLLHFLPEIEREQCRNELSFHLRGILSQLLLPSNKENVRTPIFEILLNLPLVSDLIRRNELDKLKETIKNASNLGMQTLDNGLLIAFKNGLISEADALSHADSPNNLRIALNQSLDSDPIEDRYEIIEPRGNDRPRETRRITP